MCVFWFVLLTLLTQGGKYLSPPKQTKSLISAVCVCVCVVLLTLLTQGGKYLSAETDEIFDFSSVCVWVCVCVWPPTFLMSHEKDVHVNISVCVCFFFGLFC